DDSCLEHLACAPLDPQIELLLRDLEADDQRRMPSLLRPEDVTRRRERLARLREFQRAYHAPAVVCVDARGSRWVAPREQLVRCVGAEPIVEPSPALPNAGLGRRGRR